MPRSRKSAASIVRHFEEAFEGYSWRGGGNPDAIPYWEQRYAEARERLIQHLMGDGA